jgi:lysine 6-dehydrogenase
MKVLLFGTGMQGKAALHDLLSNDAATTIVAADREIVPLEEFVARAGYGSRVRCVACDAADGECVDNLVAERPDVILDLLPVPLHDTVTAAAVRRTVHLVNASYPSPLMRELAGDARDRGIAILPEMGMDPGIDLVLLGEAARSLDSVDGIVSYGAGFPEAAAAGNPIGYKVTWSFEGVLESYVRPARVIRGGRVVAISGEDLFAPENIHSLAIDGVGTVEAFPNGDALHYAELLGMDRSRLRRLERCVLRWPGHAAFWKKLVALHLLDGEPVVVDGVAVDRKKFLAAAIEPHIGYGEEERDVVVVRIDVTGRKDGRPHRVFHQVIDRRDRGTGFAAMARTVGFSAAIGARMVVDGTITGCGLLTPLCDVPFEPFVRELAKRKIEVHCESGPSPRNG